MMRARREGGFTYLGLIVLVTIIGLVGAATLKVDALLQRAAAEEELLEIGAAFSAALTSYAEATPRGQPPQPPSLEELLKDPRFPGTRRHLRKIFVDPITGKAEWGIVWLNKGNGVNGSGGSGVVAVYSLSDRKPLKQANFDGRFTGLEGREHFSDWKFAANAQGISQGQVGQPGQPGQALAPGQPQPSLFPARGNPAGTQPAPLAPPPPPAPSAPPETAAPQEPQEPPAAEASGSGEDEEAEKEKDKGAQTANRR